MCTWNYKTTNSWLLILKILLVSAKQKGKQLPWLMSTKWWKREISNCLPLKNCCNFHKKFTCEIIFLIYLKAFRPKWLRLWRVRSSFRLLFVILINEMLKVLQLEELSKWKFKHAIKPHFHMNVCLWDGLNFVFLCRDFFATSRNFCQKFQFILGRIDCSNSFHYFIN